MKLNTYLLILFLFLTGCTDKNKPENLRDYLLSSKFNNKKISFTNPRGKGYKLIGQTYKDNTFYTKYNPEFTVKIDGKDIFSHKHEEYYKVFVENNILYRQNCNKRYNKSNQGNYQCDEKFIILSNKPWAITMDNVINKCKISSIYQDKILNVKHKMIKVICSSSHEGILIDNNIYVIFATDLGIIETGLSDSKVLTKLINISL